MNSAGLPHPVGTVCGLELHCRVGGGGGEVAHVHSPLRGWHPAVAASVRDAGTVQLELDKVQQFNPLRDTATISLAR